MTTDNAPHGSNGTHAPARQIRIVHPVTPSALPPLDDAQQAIVDSVLDGDAHAVIGGCPGAGRTTVALTLAKAFHSRGHTLRLLLPDRNRAENLLPIAQTLMPGVVRPARTTVSFAYDIVAPHWIATHPRQESAPPPRLLTGADEDALLAEIIAANIITWPVEITEDVRAMPAFRMEVRNLIARAREVGWDGETLTRYGRETGRQLWESVGALMEYWATTIAPIDQLTSTSIQLQLTTAQIERVAARIVASGEANDLPDIVIVDDLQDATTSTLELLVAIAGRGVRVIATANPDIATATYRGGEPHLHQRLIDAIGRGETPVLAYQLGPTHVGNQTLRRIVRDLESRVPITGDSARRRVGSVDPVEDPSCVEVAVWASHAQQMSAIAERVCRQVAQKNWKLSDIAVIVRSAGEVNRVSTALVRHGIDVTCSRRALTYALHPVTGTLLQLLTATDVTGERAGAARFFEHLVTSPLIGLDPLLIRRVGERAASLATGDARTEVEGDTVAAARHEVTWNSTLDMVEFLATVDVNQLLGWSKDEITAVESMIRALRVIEVAAKQRSEAPDHAIDAVWQTLGIEDRWVDSALADTPWSSDDDERLDAVISLMRTADVWRERNPQGTAEEFARHYLAQQLPTDTLAVTAQRPPGVHVLTVSQAIGRHWPVVMIASLNDQAWPLLTLPDRLTHAADVADLANGRISIADIRGQRHTAQLARQQRIADELRLLVAAVSRASETLSVDAIRTPDVVPSLFFELIADAAGVSRDDDGEIPTSTVPEGEDPRSVVAMLRRLASTPHCADAEADSQRQLARRLLAYLGAAGVPGADPLEWGGVDLVVHTRESAAGDDTDDDTAVADRLGKVPILSPSAVQRLIDCPARWFFERNGGGAVAGPAAKLGTLIHSIAERNPRGTEEELLAQLEQRWEETGIDPSTTIGQLEYTTAQEKVRQLAQFFAGIPETTEVSVEVPFDVRDGQLRLHGFIDRVEKTPEGMRVVDIKTGRFTQGDTENSIQFALYQYALHQQGDTVVGAVVYPLKNKNPMQQPRLFGEDLPEDNQQLRDELMHKIRQAADAACGSVFVANPGEYCSTCPAVRICPTRADGKRSIE